MHIFRFVTNWTFDSAIDDVWAQLTNPEQFPLWWPGFEKAVHVSGEHGKPGAVTRYRVRGDFGLVFDFNMALEQIEEPTHLLLRASGDFTGSGEWRLQKENGRTEVTYLWEVAVNRKWVRFLSRLPGARHFLERSHDRVMASGQANLAKLLVSDNETVTHRQIN